MLIANLSLLRLAATLRPLRARLPVAGGEAHRHAGVVGHTETISYAFEDVERSNGSTCFVIGALPRSYLTVRLPERVSKRCSLERPARWKAHVERP